MKELPTKQEYDWYLALTIAGSQGHCVGLKTFEKYKEIECKVKNIKFPASEEEIYKQLKDGLEINSNN